MRTAAMESPAGGLAGDGHDGERQVVLVHLLASGVLAASRLLEQGRPLAPPYPAALQRALDRLTLLGDCAGPPAPGHVMDLLSWAHRPFATWPWYPQVPGLDVQDVLLVAGKPSQACLEWAVLSQDVEGEVRENALIHNVLQACRASERGQEAYVAFRRLLVQHPAMSALDMAVRRGDPLLAVLGAALQDAYRPAPPEAIENGEAVICAGCRQLWTRDAGGVMRCQEPWCQAQGKAGARLKAREGIWWVPREVRTFISAPGRAELRIDSALEKSGLRVALWPGLDACDLLPEQVPWAADVKSWADPVRLALSLRAKPVVPPAEVERLFIVIATEQAQQRRDYVRTLLKHVSRNELTQGAGVPVDVVTENTYVTRVRTEAKRRRG